MYLLDLTCDSPAANLALDEALLDASEAGELPGPILRLWESPRPLVVVGRASQVQVEVHLEQCQSERVPVLRRCSGGAAIVAGPGCLMYAVVLSYQQYPQLRSLENAHQFVLSHLLKAVTPLVKPSLGTTATQGTCDLTIGPLKVSGNSLRCKRTHLLYHGTLLYAMNLETISRLLKHPPRTPDYRQQRAHDQFLTQIPASQQDLKSGLCQAWQVTQTMESIPEQRIEQLVRERYSQDSWNLKR